MDCMRIPVLVPAPAEAPRGGTNVLEDSMTCNALEPWTPTTVVGPQQSSHSVMPSMRLTPSTPFDAVRALHAGWVQAGWAKPSIIASGRLERMLDALEKLTLGPLARRV